MNCSAKILIEEDANKIEKLFMSEDKEFQNERASYTINKTQTGVEFLIEAKDATALRAILNSIAKSLTIYEKVKNGQNN